jgi:septation ring formation regulator EzrA
MIEMKSKKGFSLEQHEQIAHDLKIMRDRLTKMVVHVNHFYTLPVAKKVGAAADAVDKVRDVLEREFFREYHGISGNEKDKIYYPGGDFSGENFEGCENE